MQRTSAQALAFRLTDARPRRFAPLARAAVWLWLTLPCAIAIVVAALFFHLGLYDRDPLALLDPPPTAVTTTGNVVASRPHTNKGRHTGDSVWVGFTVGETYVEVRRYTPGRRLATLTKPLNVVVDPQHPTRAHVIGTDVTETGLLVLLVVTLCIALGLFVFGAARARKKLSLLEHGVLATAKLIRQHTERGSKGAVIHVLVFEYMQGTRAFERLVRTQKPARLLDDDEEPVIFDERDPERAFMLDELALSPRRDRDGVVVTTRSGPAVAAFVTWLLLVPAALFSVAMAFVRYA